MTEEELYVAWGIFTEKLRGKNKHSAVTIFAAAKLKVTNNNSIEIITESDLQKSFIEGERAELILHLQDYFNNRALVYQIIIIEKEATTNPGEKLLNRKQQYLKIIEEYPLVKELKDRLKLELE